VFGHPRQLVLGRVDADLLAVVGDDDILPVDRHAPAAGGAGDDDLLHVALGVHIDAVDLAEVLVLGAGHVAPDQVLALDRGDGLVAAGGGGIGDDGGGI